MQPTQEQQRIIDHNPSMNGRVLAGPGTGKSWTCVSLISHLSITHQNLDVRLLTFTRAATQELEKKVNEAKLVTVKPTTIHSFALSLLLRNPKAANLPQPIRIPDDWELKKLIHSDIARLLRKRGFIKVNVKMIDKLEMELSARWQSLDENVQLISNLEPQIRNAYIGLWDTHRNIFGYTLLGELPFRAGNAIEDFDLNTNPMDLLIVDEYQDLNEADIRLIRLLNKKGARVLAIGDDDQSIYSFRMAAPEGIRRFQDEFGNCEDYRLTISQRCGKNILDAATTLIETAVNRPPKPPLVFKQGSAHGSFLYLRFNNEKEEVNGVVDLIQARRLAGVPLGEIAVLVRSQVDTWSNLLMPELMKHGIQAVSTDWIDSVFKNVEVRKGLAKLHLVVDRSDSLAWWTLLHLEKGISQEFCDFIFNTAANNQAKFGETLLRLFPDFSEAPTVNSSSVASRLVNQVLEDISQINPNDVDLDDTGWARWVIDRIGREYLNDDAIHLFEETGKLIPAKQGLGYFLGQLEPVAQDLATECDAVRIMTITKSKGNTVNTCIVMGVEYGIIPHPKGKREEELRLLYVAMTRATEMSILTFSHLRNKQTAWQGEPNVNRLRGRCPLLENLPIGQYQEGREIVQKIKAEMN